MNLKITDQTPEARTGGSNASLGAQLRAAREAQGASIRQISEQTRLSPRYLEAIEADDYKRLPGGMYNRNFIKAYAHQLGFPEEQAMDLYTRASREQGTPADEEMPTSYQPRVYTNGDSSRSPAVTFLIGALMLGVLSLVAFAAVHWWNRQSANPAPQAEVQPTPTAAPIAEQTPASVPTSLTVQIRAADQQIWLRAKPDDSAATERILQPNGDSLEYTIQNQLNLQYARPKASALQVTINGRQARVPTEARSTNGNLVEMTITRDGYEQFLQ